MGECLLRFKALSVIKLLSTLPLNQGYDNQDNLLKIALKSLASVALEISAGSNFHSKLIPSILRVPITCCALLRVPRKFWVSANVINVVYDICGDDAKSTYSTLSTFLITCKRVRVAFVYRPSHLNTCVSATVGRAKSLAPHVARIAGLTAAKKVVRVGFRADLPLCSHF